MASVSLCGVKKKYDDKLYVVNDFNLEVKDKEFIILVGPSGCGKSTTLRMIAGLEDVSEGEIYIDGKKANGIDAKDRDIAMVFQNYALYPHMTVYDNMAFSLKLRKLPKKEIRQKVNEAARILNIEHLLKRKPKALSGGQRQRVAMGRAIVRNPKVFLMDEPLSNLDAKLRTQMRVELAKLHQKLGATIIYVTHDQVEAMTLGTRIVVLKDGVIQQCDTPETLYHKPKNMFVGGFIGSPQMNFFEGEIVDNHGQMCLGFADAYIPLTKEKEELVQKLNLNQKKIIFGIRPQHIYESSAEGSLIFKIEVKEILGAQVILFGKVKGNDCRIELSNEKGYTIGDKITISMDVNKIHIFDKETGEALIN